MMGWLSLIGAVILAAAVLGFAAHGLWSFAMGLL